MSECVPACVACVVVVVVVVIVEVVVGMHACMGDAACMKMRVKLLHPPHHHRGKHGQHGDAPPVLHVEARASPFFTTPFGGILVW